MFPTLLLVIERRRSAIFVVNWRQLLMSLLYLEVARWCLVYFQQRSLALYRVFVLSLCVWNCYP